MPTVTRARTVRAAPDEVWGLVTDPERLPLWWPAVRRVEGVSAEGWTMVLTSPKGKTVRADYTVVEARPPRFAAWRQEVEHSPFERIMSEASIEIALDEEGEDATRVVLTSRSRLRGFARLGLLQMRLAVTRQLDEALDGLERTLVGGEA